MDKETYLKAMDEHGEKLYSYSDKLAEFIKEMLHDSCTVSDVVGVLEIGKIYAFEQAKSAASLDALVDALKDMCGGDDD